MRLHRAKAPGFDALGELRVHARLAQLDPRPFFIAQRDPLEEKPLLALEGQVGEFDRTWID